MDSWEVMWWCTGGQGVEIGMAVGGPAGELVIGTAMSAVPTTLPAGTGATSAVPLVEVHAREGMEVEEGMAAVVDMVVEVTEIR